MKKHVTKCAGINTGKRKLDVAVDGGAAPPDPRLAALAEHQTLIDQISDQIARCKDYRESCRDPQLRRFWEDEIRRYRGLFRQQLKQLLAAIRRHPDLSERLESTGLQPA